MSVGGIELFLGLAMRVHLLYNLGRSVMEPLLLQVRNGAWSNASCKMIPEREERALDVGYAIVHRLHVTRCPAISDKLGCEDLDVHTSTYSTIGASESYW